MSYTHSTTGAAVRAIFNLFNLGAELNEKLKTARRDLSAERYKERYDAYHLEFQTARSNAFQTVLEACDAIPGYVNASKSRDLNIGDAENDLKLLALPVALSGEDLALMLERNLDNMIFVRTVTEYAQKHGLDTDARFIEASKKAAVASQKHAYEKNGKMLHDYLRGYFPDEGILMDDGKLQTQREAFQTIEESGLLAKLDASI